jgi:pimeloyl-ACP methyl ester carboxylesterase
MPRRINWPRLRSEARISRLSLRGLETKAVSGHLGVFGHSLGGLSAAHACAEDPRIRACMNQDAEFRGFPFVAGDSSKIIQPFLFFATQHSLYERPGTTPPSDQALAREGFTRARYDSLMHGYRMTQEHALAALPRAIRIMVETPGFGHRSFMDLGLLGAADSTAAAQALQGLELVRRYTKAFFDREVKGKSGDELDESRQAGVTVERF